MWFIISMFPIMSLHLKMPASVFYHFGFGAHDMNFILFSHWATHKIYILKFNGAA